MHFDYGVVTGTHHASSAQPCQDYAFSGQEHDFAWAAIADGCSGATGKSDVGARVMVLAAQTMLRRYGPALLVDPGALGQALQEACTPWRELLQPDDLLATLALMAGDRREVRATILGDGALIAKYRDGRVSVIEVSYPDNAPEYPAYHFEPERIRQWRESFPTPRQIVRRTVDADGQLLDEVTLSDNAWAFSPAKEGIVCMAVASDGIASRTGLTAVQTALEIMDFKTVKGTFVQRRLGSAARRAWRSSHTEPYDDLAVAALWFGDGDV